MSNNVNANKKQVIYNLIDEIIAYEDQIKSYEQNSGNNKFVNSDLVKNKENIAMLTQFIANEKRIAGEKIAKLKKEIDTTTISSNSFNESNFDRTFTQKEYEQKLLKQKFYDQSLTIYNNEYVSMRENLKMLKEEKLQLGDDLVTLMSIKESYEEIFQSAKFILNSEPSSSIDTLNSNIEKYELRNFSPNKISSFIYKQLLLKCISPLEQSLNELIKSTITEQFDLYQNGNITIDEFISNSVLCIVNYNDTTRNNINAKRFEIYLRYAIKIFYFENIIIEKIRFVNNDYRKIKAVLKEKYNAIREKIDETNLKIANELKESKRIYNELNKGNELQKEIENIIKESNRNIENYQREIRDIEKINQTIETKINSDKSDKEIFELKRKIDDLFYQIKNQIKQEGEKEDEMLNMFIEEINAALSSEQIQKDNTNINTKNQNSYLNISSQKENSFNVSSISIANKNSTSSFFTSHITPIKTTSKSLPPIRFDIAKLSINKKKFQPSNHVNSKISPLYTPCDCYIQLSEENEGRFKDFNPIDDYDIIPEQKNFNKGVIQLNRDNQNISITQIAKETVEININLLEKTLVTGAMKCVLNVLQLYNKKYKKDIQKFVNDKNFVLGELKMNSDDIIKCVYNKYFYFSIILTVSQRINLIFLNYNSFKNWLNGTAFLIKNKPNIIDKSENDTHL